MQNFSTLGIPEPLLQSLAKMGFNDPTPIQAAAIPLAMQGRDILGSAQTGTGKTAAFGIPLLSHLMTNKQSCAVIMTPTRELAAQVLQALQKMLPPSAMIKSALLIGGDSMFKQLNQLKARPRLIVGTPGRMNDHLQQGTLRLQNADFLVLDETDRMLDMGFEVQIDKVIKCLAPKRQTLLFSATLPPYIVKLADKYQTKPERIAVGSTNTPLEKIDTELVHIGHPEKYTALLGQLEKRTGSVIVFVKTKHGADRLAKKLNSSNHLSDAIHGNLNQGKRTRVIDAFRGKKYRVLVATDVAARGLDIPHIEHVINYDLPQCPEDYIHRLGRTARAGAEGSAVCFISPEERSKWADIQYMMDPTLRKPSGGGSQSRKPQSSRGGRGAQQRFGEQSQRRRSEQPQQRRSEPSKRWSEPSSQRRAEPSPRWADQSQQQQRDPSQERAPQRQREEGGECSHAAAKKPYGHKERRERQRNRRSNQTTSAGGSDDRRAAYR